LNKVLASLYCDGDFARRKTAMPAKKFDEARQGAFWQLDELRGALGTLEEKRYLAKAGITFQQFLVLLAARSVEPPVTQADISRAVNRNRNSISLMVERMERLGLIERSRSKIDRREIHVVLTSLGSQKLSDALSVGIPLTERLCSVFSGKELAQMVAMMGKLQDRIASDLGPNSPDLREAMSSATVWWPRSKMHMPSRGDQQPVWMPDDRSPSESNAEAIRNTGALGLFSCYCLSGGQ
jgi:MarR family transcriptional regulator, organic hydroperoxide resistance regulator